MIVPPAVRKPAPAPDKPAPAPDIDRHDPLVRFQLLTVSTYNGVQKAYVKDLLLKEAKLIEIGESIGECKLISLSLKDQSIRLKPASGTEFDVYRDKPAKKSVPAAAPTGRDA